jgi:hypothetical protein
MEGASMKLRVLLLSLLIAAGLAACGKPVPADHAAYVGEWQRPEMYLLITQDGSVSCKRLKAGATVSVDGPLKGFQGNEFSVGIGPMTTTFHIDSPPHQTTEGAWRMTVDGAELTRTAQ